MLLKMCSLNYQLKNWVLKVFNIKEIFLNLLYILLKIIFFKYSDNNAQIRLDDVSFECESDNDNADEIEGNELDDDVSFEYKSDNDNADELGDDDVFFEYESNNDNTSGTEFDDAESTENINSNGESNSDNENENVCSYDNDSSDSSFDGEFGPHFLSSTSASIFAWITKHMICK